MQVVIDTNMFHFI